MSERAYLFSESVWNSEEHAFQPALIATRGQEIERVDWKFSEKLPAGTEDLRKWKIGPSGIDLHVHARDFEEAHKETFETLEQGAFRGGVALVVCMANSRPRLDSVQMLERFDEKARARTLQMLTFAAVSENIEGKIATDWKTLLKHPRVAGLSDDGKPILDAALFEKALRATEEVGKFISLHEEDLHISSASQLHLSETSMRMGIMGSPADSEARMVERDLQIGERLKAHLHFGHMSSKFSMALIREAKDRGVSCSAELTPHHGLLTVDVAETFPVEKRSLFKVCPVIREKEDRAALWKGLHDGTLDCFGTDHAPHSHFEKDLPYAQAMHGMVAMENSFTIYNEVRLHSELSWKRFFECWSERPAEVLKASGRMGRIRAGLDASFIIFDSEKAENLSWKRGRSENTPFGTQKMRGVIEQHWIRGKKVYDRRKEK